LKETNYWNFLIHGFSVWGQVNCPVNPIERPKNNLKNSLHQQSRFTLVSGSTFWLYMYFLIDYFLHFSARVPAYGKFRPTLLVVVVLSAMLLSQKSVLKNRGGSPVFSSLLLFLGYILLSLPLVAYPGSVIRSNLQPFIKALVFFYFTAFIIDSPKRLKIFLFVFVFCQVFRVLEPLGMHFTSGYWGSSTYLGYGEFADRLSGSPADVVNPNGLGFVIVTVIPFLHYLVFPKGFWGKILYFSLSPMLLYALILTMSRGAFLALLVVFVVVFKDTKHKIILVVIFVGLMVGGWASMSSIQKDRYLSLVDKSETHNADTKSGRVKGIVYEFKVAFSRPIVGHGLGTTAETKFHLYGGTHVSHNFYAEMLIETGLIGAMFFLSFLFTVYQSLQRTKFLLKNKNFNQDSLVGRLLKCLTTVFIMYSVYSINYWGLSQYYWYLFAGTVFAFNRLVTLSLSQRSTTPSSSPPSLSKKW